MHDGDTHADVHTARGQCMYALVHVRRRGDWIETTAATHALSAALSESARDIRTSRMRG